MDDTVEIKELEPVAYMTHKGLVFEANALFETGYGAVGEKSTISPSSFMTK